MACTLSSSRSSLESDGVMDSTLKNDVTSMADEDPLLVGERALSTCTVTNISNKQAVENATATRIQQAQSRIIFFRV